ncbi:MAG: hypothetical protein NZZ60_00550 [Bacteroidia bacterium]|nr:hypothetical protein [Bacteroidia bacterium]MDW8417677.1 hypothetical protein [Bacteroidia bacterium]
MRTHVYITAVAAALTWAQQTTLIDPTTDGSFEGTGTSGWNLVSQTGTPNRWCLGGASVTPPSHGSRCAYISVE